jgi:hypothetical protein
MAPTSKESPEDAAEGSCAVEFEFSVIHQPDFELTGAESFRWKLSGGEDICIPMSAMILTGGIYNLQCIRLTTYEGKDEELPYVFPLQWIVHVHEIGDDPEPPH